MPKVRNAYWRILRKFKMKGERKEGRRKGEKEERKTLYLNLEIAMAATWVCILSDFFVLFEPMLSKPPGRGLSLTTLCGQLSLKLDMPLPTHLNGYIIFYWTDKPWTFVSPGLWIASVDGPSRDSRSPVMLQEVSHNLLAIAGLLPFLHLLQWTTETFPGGLGCRARRLDS